MYEQIKLKWKYAKSKVGNVKRLLFDKALIFIIFILYVQK